MNPLRVIFAVDSESERSAFSSLAASGGMKFQIKYPDNIAEVEALYSKDGADVIITDFRFHNGALADWLTFWPLPAVLLVDSGTDLERVERSTRDEASVFVERRDDGSHMRLVPVLVRKVVNIRESVRRQNAHLQMTEHQYLNLLQAIPDIVYILDSSGRFIYLNDAVRSLGYEPARLIGRHFSDIIHPEDVPKVSRIAVLEGLQGSVTGAASAPKLFDERRSGSRMTKNLDLRLRLAPNIKPSNDPDVAYARINAYGEVSCSGFKLPEFEGRGLGTVGIIRDITVRKEQERELEESLAARELRLKEIHHRVKNNLQVVSSLLNLQESTLRDPEAREVFVECQTQIQSMAMVHEELYRGGDLQRVDMQKYFEELVEYLAGIYDGNMHGVSCLVEAPEVTLDLDGAIPVALIVNELVSNCFKHAFGPERGGMIHVSMNAENDDWLLKVLDDGRGFPPGSGLAAQASAGAAPDEAAASARGRPGPGVKRRGIGTELVLALSAQLRGKVEFSNGAGAQVTVRFPRA
ncbi:MAG TPA: histidine kinase dimerization/phosphoacceptor domain -containing protein [Rectinemataceae bacterium]|nr:histidine kinase dimerization/phosphoacceptor domain -containing protein [Rectinemataceae bacterium]